MKKVCVFVSLLFISLTSHARELMNLVDIHGIRDNQLIGYGLVVGLDGTGDKSQTKFTEQSIKNMLEQFGLQLESRVSPKVKNVAAVSVTASVGPMTGAGQQIDVIVSSIGDAKSLRGGTLLLTPLKGVDGNVYAIAQGNVVVSGIGVEGQDGSSVSMNIPTVGRIPSGATVEREIQSDFNDQNMITLNLKTPSFKTAKNISRAINDTFGPKVAVAISLNQIKVQAPRDTHQRVMFVSMLEELDVEEGKRPARVVFNSRTGTVVMSETVRIKRAAISYGGITISIAEDQYISQPNAFNEGGQTEGIQDSTITIQQEKNQMFIWEEGVDLQTIVNTVNGVGASPDDLMQILQALDEIGALNAELLVI
ncbi:flagellar basal body P-ring protein FlgI [Vibrio sp.]|nr:flagellar basal body P-ring protein FlgI [Vibrio sp.]